MLFFPPLYPYLISYLYRIFHKGKCVCVPAGPSSLSTYPLLSVITRQPPSSLAHIPQPSPPGRVTHLPMVSPQHALPGEPTPSETPVSISSESETEHGAVRLKKPRRSRTIFTELQLMGLEKKFQKQKYLSTPDRSAHAIHYAHLAKFPTLV